MRFRVGIRGNAAALTARSMGIDAVAVTGDGRVALVMGYGSSQTVDTLRVRVQEYVAFALDGQMVRDYPETAGRPVEIVVAPEGAATPDLLAYVEVVKPRLATYGIGIAIRNG